MPYVSREVREALDRGDAPRDAGALNYAVSGLVDRYLAQCVERDGRLRYAHLNEVIGVLECAKLELYRRLAAPYEDVKIAEHGDVYTVDPTG